MVHVISCHHFVSQEVFQIQNDPLAFCCSQGKILVATDDRSIKIHDLDSRGNVLHSFSSIDNVEQIIYCDAGNYIATLEKKSVKHSVGITYVRIYFNWWMDPRGQPIKVHIAGSSPRSPHESWSDHFEIVELPLNKTTNCIACCKTTAALAVSLDKTISVFCYNGKSSNATSYQSHDFSHFFEVEMNFIVRSLSICKNYIASMSVNQVQVFKVSVAKENEPPSNVNKLKERINAANDLDEHFVEWKFEPCVGSLPDLTWDNDLKEILHENSFPISVSFRSVDKENQSCERAPQNCEIIGPVLTANGYRLKVKLDPNAFELWSSLSSTNIDAVTLLYREFEFDDVESQLMSLNLVSFYESDNYDHDLDPLHAAAVASKETFSYLPWCTSNLDARPQLKAIGCFFSTEKEGFLYDVTEETQLIGSYTYTSNLKSAVLDFTFLHALTDAGLETYTLHLAHCAFQYIENLDEVSNACPHYSSPVCLLGLRPFLGATKLVMAENYLVVVSSLEDDMEQSTGSENGNCALYSLKKPSPQQVFSDLLETGQTYKSSSPSTYNLVLKEGHMILRTFLFLCKNYNPDAESLFRKSCILLADYYACSSNASERHLAAPYYLLSKLSIEEVVQRVFNFHNQHKHSNVLKSLILYMNSTLLGQESLPMPDAISKGIAESILNIYLEECPENLWKVILCSGMSTYRVDKAMLMLKRRITNKRQSQTSASIAADTIAIVSLLLKKGNPDSAQNMLLSIQKGDLIDILTEKYQCFLSDNKLTAFGKFVRKVRPEAFVEMLGRLVKTKLLVTRSVLDMFQNESPNVSVANIPQLKEFLELYWRECKSEFQEDPSFQVLLLDIYLCRLGNGAFPPSAKTSFSFRTRPRWLNQLPPFNGQPVARNCVLVQKNADKEKEDAVECINCCCFSCNEDLIKLQCLLSHPKAHEDLLAKLRFVLSVRESEEIKGYLSLEMLSLSEDDAIAKLVEVCPSAIFQFCVDTFKQDEEKWSKIYKLLSSKLEAVPEDDPKHEIYSKTIHNVLSHISEIVSIPTLVSLLSDKNKETMKPYIRRCCNKHQANQLRNKIVALGNEIKIML